MTDHRTEFRTQYFLERNKTTDIDLASYCDWLELQLNRKAPDTDPATCVHPFNRVISAGALHHCCDCKKNIKSEK